MREPQAWFNGRFVPDSEVLISFRDSVATRGDGVYDTARTFGGRLFKLRAHLERLWQSLAYVRIDPGYSLGELEQASLELCSRNWDGEDFWLTQRVTRGVPGGSPTVIVECSPIPFAERAHYYRDGVPVRTSTVRRTPPWAQSPQAKTMSILNLRLAEQEVHDADPTAWPLLLDEHGNLCEALGSNVFVVADGRLVTPQARYVLPGIARATVLELARGLGIEVEERDADLYEAAAADELFLTSTSLCVCPVASLNGYRPRAGELPGPVTRRLQEAFAELVGFDFVGQYLGYLDAG
jgi:branched-chain amino acid aminotransferase